MSTQSVDNAGAGVDAPEAEPERQTVIKKNSRCTMELEGPEGKEALKKVTLNNGDVKQYKGDEGEERYYRIDKADGSVETYKGTRGRESITEVFVPGERTVLYGGGKRALHKALVIDHFARQVDIYTRDGEGAATSSNLLKVEWRKVYARGSELDEWEEIAIPWEEIKARGERRRAEAARAERAKRAREEREKADAERAKRQREAEEMFLRGPTLVVGGDMKGEDTQDLEEVDIMNREHLDQPNSC